MECNAVQRGGWLTTANSSANTGPTATPALFLVWRATHEERMPRGLKAGNQPLRQTDQGNKGWLGQRD